MLYVMALTAACLIALVGVRILFSLYALSLGASAFQVGLLAATYQALSFVIAMPIGGLGDRFGARWPLAIGSALGAIGLALPYFFPTLPGLFAGMALCGIWGVSNLVMTQSLTGSISTPETLARNFANFSLVASCCWMLGAPLAGFAIDQVGYRLACLVLVPLALVSLLLGLFARPLAGKEKQRKAAPGRFGELLADRRLWWVLTLSGTVQLAGDLYPFYVPLHGHAVGLSGSAIGVVVAASHAAAFAVRLWLQVLIKHLGEEPLLAWGLGLSAVAVAVVPLFTSAPGLALVSFAFGIGTAFGQPITTMLMYRESPPGREGIALGLRASGNGLLRLVAPPLFGGLAAAAGIPVLFLVTGTLVGSVAALIGWRGRAEKLANRDRGA